MSASGTVRFAAIGEAPGSVEDAQGLPFVGPSGKFLRQQLAEVGLNPEKVAYLNTVSCWSHEGGKARPPTDTEMAACRSNLLDQLAAAKARYALLIGATALSVWNSRLSLSHMHGYIFRWDRQRVMPIYHPAAILRQKSRVIGFRYDLKVWASVLNGVVPDEDARCPVCVVCQQKPVTYDDQWVPRCAVHEG